MRARAWRFLLVSGATIGVALAACSEDDAPAEATAAGTGGSVSSAGGGGSGGTAVDPECTAYGEAVCGKLDECAPVYLSLTYGNLTVCSYRQMLACQLERSNPGSAYDAATIGACAEALAGAACGQIVNDAKPACAPGGGEVADGGFCVGNWQCQSGYCVVTEANGCGTCQPRLGDGASCASDGGACLYGSGCSGMQICMPLVPENGSCAGGEPCDLFLTCIDGTCQRGVTSGAACDNTHPCSFWVEGQFCNATPVCEAVVYAGPGDMCGTTMDGKPAYCTGGATCSPASMTCIPPAEDDAACGGTANRGCFVPRRCIDGHCSLPDVSVCGMEGMGGGGTGGQGGV
jgi:hypothetical protein